MEETNDYNEWINKIADTNTHQIEMAAIEDVLEDVGEWVLFQYNDKAIWEFIFFHETQN